MRANVYVATGEGAAGGNVCVWYKSRISWKFRTDEAVKYFSSQKYQI